MKVLVYSLKEFEKSYLIAAFEDKLEVKYSKDLLDLDTASQAENFDAISIFTADDASADVLAKLHSYGVKYLTTRAAGYDNIDIKKAFELGITVANTPAYSPFSIAEYAVAMLLYINRKISLAESQIQTNNFSLDNLIGFDLHDKIVGVIGVGKIGQVFVRIMNGFGCRILGYDPVQNHNVVRNFGMEYVDIETLFKNSDIISLHTNLNESTYKMVDKSLVSLMKKGSILINTSRGAIVNTLDIIEGLENGNLGFYCADVYEKERGIFFKDLSDTELNDEILLKLINMPNVLITPHQAFATKEALTNIAVTTFKNLECWKMNDKSPNEIRLPAN
ncbi:MAG: 2-hydroxyacid dehydrogenase [Daejeonella sp.]